MNLPAVDRAHFQSCCSLQPKLAQEHMQAYHRHQGKGTVVILKGTQEYKQRGSWKHLRWHLQGLQVLRPRNHPPSACGPTQQPFFFFFQSNSKSSLLFTRSLLFLFSFRVLGGGCLGSQQPHIVSTSLKLDYEARLWGKEISAWFSK